MESTAPAVQDIGENVERIGVAMAKRHRVVAKLDLRLAVASGVHALFRGLRHLQGHDVRWRARGRGQPAEIALGKRLGFGDIEVADNGRSEVSRRVVRVVILLRLRQAIDAKIGRPADDRPAIRMGLPEHRAEELVELARGGRFRSQPPLFVDDIPLRVKLTKDRLQ